MAIYTRKGDQGRTSIYGEKRTRPKDDPRISAIGAIDELNSALGLVSSFLTNRKLRGVISRLQSDLFEIGAELASPQNPPFKVSEAKVRELENLIDGFEGKLAWPGLFILPGGHPAAAAAHVARTLCRRTEREIVSFSRKVKLNPAILKYMNRLSSLLYVLARIINKEKKIKEPTWPGKSGK